MKPDLFSPRYDCYYNPESVAKLTKKIIALLEHHALEGRPHVEFVEAMNMAMAHIIINASLRGGSIKQMKRIACEYLMKTVDRCLPVEPENDAATMLYTGRA